MPAFIDLTGRRFGRLVIVRIAGRKNGEVYWSCLCDCGAMHESPGGSIRRGDTRSCGCLQKDNTPRKHGATNRVRGATPEYRSWMGMNSRCYLKTTKGYHRYGGRGITVCDRWRYSFVNFLADMGTKPSPNHSIDRVNNDGNYEPGNCRWATRKEQNRNRCTTVFITIGSLSQSVSEWSRNIGISKSTIMNRAINYLTNH